ncbi:MAG: TadE/TadG family type IV pilus assembly protein [Planctomycetaceae bacterium]
MSSLSRRRSLADNRSRRGVAAVEMAFVLPVFFLVILGMIELGRGIMVAQLAANAAREAARSAIIDGSTNTTVTTVAKNFMQTAANVSAGDVTVDIAVSGSGGGQVANANPQDLITVSVSVPYSKVSWLPPKYLSGKSISGMAAMRHE